MAEGVIDHPSETTEILIVIVTEIDVDLEAAVEEEIETIVSTTEKITEMVKVKKTMALMLRGSQNIARTQTNKVQFSLGSCLDSDLVMSIYFFLG